MASSECPGPHVPISASTPTTSMEHISKQLDAIQKSLDNVLSHLSDLLEEEAEEASDELVGSQPAPSAPSYGSRYPFAQSSAYSARSGLKRAAASDFGPHPSFGPMAFPKRNPFFQ